MIYLSECLYDSPPNLMTFYANEDERAADAWERMTFGGVQIEHIAGEDFPQWVRDFAAKYPECTGGLSSPLISDGVQTWWEVYVVARR